jgi:hypothetical protein
VNLQFGQRLLDDLCFPAGLFRLFKVFEEIFDRIVILLQDRDGRVTGNIQSNIFVSSS